MKNDYLTRLRYATRDAHKQVELTTNGNDLISNPNKDSYALFLLTHYLFYNEVSHQMKLANEIDGLKLEDLPKQEVIGIALLEDLEILNIRVSTIPTIYDYQSAFHALGMYYVMRGSTMGNRIIFNELSKNKNFVSWNASNFLKTSLKTATKDWTSFKNELLIYLNDNYKEIENGSLEGFQLFGKLHLKAKKSLDLIEA
ncbi:biliverdin-producing heme oxygenase [Aquimarina spongiae]|uniref:Heme oxygenase n=1 Tax=Aquimarina spongiae TaxID=570521 RepID=A0A1M6KC44_9FLAO|nr:biliverdin-producing heme oxygenase [Aquimarina spongiae]SHJ56513.1 Heme oxygenase [Aquimarina spongiae]